MKWFAHLVREKLRALTTEKLEALAGEILSQVAKGNASALKFLAELLDRHAEDNVRSLTDEERIERIDQMLERARNRRTRPSAR